MRFSRSSTYKIFHLVNDVASKDSGQKVFLVENHLEKLKRELKGKLGIIGLVGPSHELQSYLRRARGQPNEGVMSSEIEVGTQIDLSLDQTQIAALFVVQGAQALTSSSESPQEFQVVYLCFVTSDEFFYSKPLSENSIKYLLIRFMGDLCTDINILHDEKMQKEFEKQGCPFNASKKKISKIKVVKRTQRDIIAKDVPCDFSPLYNYDPDYAKKLSLTSSLHARNALYINKTLEGDFRKQIETKLKKDQMKLWELIFKKHETDIKKILLHISEPDTSQNTKIIKDLINIHKQLYNLTSEFGKTALETSIRLYTKRSYSKWWVSQKFKYNIYYYIISQNCSINPENRTFYVAKHDEYGTVCINALQDIIEEAKHEQNLYQPVNYYYNFMAPIIWQAWQQIKPKMSDLIQKYYETSQLLIAYKKNEEEEAISLVLFQLKAINVERIVIGDHLKITLSETILSQKVGERIAMKNIDRIEVYELRNSQNSKLICLKMIKTDSNSSSIVLLSYNNNDFSHICSYKRSNILFRFHSQNQKAYIINMSEDQIVTFKIDSLERIVEEKTKSFHRNHRNIIDFGVSIFPTQTIYYLDKQCKALYSVDLHTGDEIIYDRSNNDEIKYLSMPGTEKYEYLRTFNQDMYVALGNKKVIEIFKPNSADGKLLLKKTISLDATFLGSTILSQNLNQYLIIFDSNKSKGIAYQNMNCETIVKKQYEQKNLFKGNPVLDIFYGAKQKFGEYKNYTTINDNPKQKQIRLHHIFKQKETGQKLSSYMKQLALEGHQSYLEEYQITSVKKEQLVPAQSFLSQVQARIPIQLCTLQNSNIVPLIRGKLQNYHFFKQMSIAERSKLIQFGIIQQLLKRKPQKRVIVVSIMGAQSTGKSYLMNLLFGTRFTVSSARCTIGIWLSLVQTSDVNYLLMDCEGLFAVHRDSKQEEKLIRVLTSISDYTLLNQNMSMTNRGFVQLLERIAESVKSSALQNKQLYKGELFVIVRDVKSSEAEGIETQFYKSFQFYQKNRSKYIEQLFGGHINLFSVEHFEKKEFLKDVKSIRDHIKVNGMNRPIRTSMQILESLKVIVNQLTCDDSRNFYDEMITYKAQKSKDEVLKLWKYGGGETCSAVIRGLELNVSQKDIEITNEEFKNESSYPIQALDKLFKQSIIKDKPLKTTQYAQVYRQYNQFILRFFQQRYEEVEKKVLAEIELNKKNNSEQKISLPLLNLQKLILSHKQKLRLCMEKCSEDSSGCILPCTSKFRHKFDIESEKQSARVEKDGVEKDLISKQLTEQQKQKTDKGIEQLEEKNKSELTEMQELKQLISSCMQKQRQKTSIAFNISQNNQKIDKEQNYVRQNNKSCLSFADLIQKLKKLSELEEECLTSQSLNIIDNISNFLGQSLVENGQLLQQEGANIIQQQYSKIESNILAKSRETQLQIENNTKREKELSKLLNKALEAQSQLSTQEKKMKTHFQGTTKEVDSKSMSKNQLLQKLYLLQQQVETKNALISQTSKTQNRLNDERAEQMEKMNHQKEKLVQKNKKLNQLTKTLSCPIYSNNSQSEFILPQILRLKQLKIQLNEKKVGLENTQNQIELNEIKNKLVIDKIINEGEDIDKIIEQTQNYLTRQDKKLKHLKGETLEARKSQISQLQRHLERIIQQKDWLDRAQKTKKDQKDFRNQLEQIKSIFVTHGYETEWSYIQDLINIPQVQKTKANSQEKPLELFLQNLIERLSGFLKKDEAQRMIKSSVQEIHANLQQKLKQKNELLQKYDDFDQNEIIKIDARLEELEEQIARLQHITENKSAIFNLFREGLKQQIERNLDFSSDLGNIFKEITEKNKAFSANINYQQKKVEIQGEPDQSLLQISKMVFLIIKELTQKEPSLLIQEEQYKNFQNSQFSEEAFNDIKQLIDFATKKFEQEESKKIKKHISQRLVSKYSKNLDTKGKNYQDIFTQIAETILKLTFKGKNESRRLNLQAEVIQIKAQIQRIQSKINQSKSLIQKIQSERDFCRRSKQNTDSEVRAIKSQANDLKKKKEKLQNQIKDLKNVILAVETALDQISKDIVKNQKQLDQLQVQVSELTKRGKILKQRREALQIIDPKATKLILQAWRMEHQVKSSKLSEIKNLKQKNAENQIKANQLNSDITFLKQKIGDNKIDEVHKKIDSIQVEIENLAELKIKLKQISRLQEKLQILKKRYEEIKKSEKSLCKCLTNHKCQQECQAGCLQAMCGKGAGHHGQHLCNKPDHRCKEKCAFNEKCLNGCSEAYDHQEQISHSCHSSHVCENKCKFCDKNCCNGLFEDHSQHSCKGQDGCQYKCLLCDNKCSSADHKHDDTAKQVQIWQENKETKERRLVNRKLHICDRQHDCLEKCNQKGICAYQYKDQIKKWSKNGCERNYNYTQQVEVRNPCLRKISVGKLKHQPGECNCNQPKHKCDKRCPDCGSLCFEQIGHQGKHRTEHRNQQQLLYAAQQKNKEIKVGKTGEDFLFTVGDVSLPTRCHSSCQSKGRAHYHLVQCKGDSSCLAKKEKVGAKHSPLTYYPYHDKQYDMVLCKIYWQLHNFQPPTEKEQFDKCSFTCPYEHSGNKNPIFCTSKAWHSFSSKFTDHQFQCSQMHKPTQFTGLQICFLIDATGSMSRFVDECQKTVKQIIKIAESSKKKVDLRFSIVGYRDHEMSKSNITISLKKLCEDKKKQLQKLPVANFHNEKFQDRQFLVFLQKLEKKYEQNKGSQDLRSKFSEKQLFVLDYHFPFYFDLASTDDMVNPVKVVSLLNPLAQLLTLLSALSESKPEPKFTLRQILMKELQQSLENLLKSDKQEQQNKDRLKLLEISDFSNSAKTLEFLEKLEAEGGGDPPEAVLDGMDAACKVSWTKQPNMLKYIFHLFDAPPHGRIFGTNNGDRYPDGCPCHKNHESIIKNINALGVNYVIYPLTPRVNGALQLFEMSGLKFERKKIDKDRPEDFALHVAELICKSIQQNEIMISRSEC